MKKLLSAAAMTAALITPAQASSITYDCDFPRQSNQTGNHAVTKKFAMTFSYDAVTKEAVMVGNNGVSDVHMLKGEWGKTFLEPLGSGAVQSTTILPSGEAVHSRHSILFDEIIPSQYYGKCSTR